MHSGKVWKTRVNWQFSTISVIILHTTLVTHVGISRYIIVTFSILLPYIKFKMYVNEYNKTLTVFSNCLFCLFKNSFN